MMPVDRRDFVMGVVAPFFERYEIANAPSQPTVTEFILAELVAPDEQWQELQRDERGRFETELQQAGGIIRDYLMMVNHEVELASITAEDLRGMHGLLVHKLEDKWGCSMYIIKIC